MRKILLLILLALSVFLCSCSNTEKVPSISDPVIARIIDKKTSMPIEPVTQFVQSDPAIYFTIKIQDLPKGTKLKAIWKYLNDNTEISSEITSEGTGYEAFTLKRTSAQFPAGQYEVTASTTIKGKTLETKGKFTITAEAKPVHLLNPITAKGIDDQNKLNPVDITSQFHQSDPVIYFIVQSKDLPPNTKVSCIWYYVDLGDTLSHELVTDGSRNIAFDLKPEEGKALPAGKYIVSATVTVNNETESISKEFEILQASE